MAHKFRNLNLFIITIGVLILFFRIFGYKLNGVWTNAVFIVYLITFLGLIFAIKAALKKKFLPLFIFSAFIVVSILTPFEYIYAVVYFKVHRNVLENVVDNFHKGKYDSLIRVERHPDYGIRISNQKNRVIDLFKDSSTNAVIFIQNFGTSGEDYNGILYISNTEYMKNQKITKFLKRDLKYKKINLNWYWFKNQLD